MNQNEIKQLMRDPVASELLSSNIPARLAYTGTDGLPRAIPIGFLWDGSYFVLATEPSTPKVAALRANPEVALTIDTNGMPPHVLLVRGTTSIDIVNGPPQEYLDGAKKYVPADMYPDWEAQVRNTYKQMARIRVQPTWAKILDFETRLPSFLERLATEQGV